MIDNNNELISLADAVELVKVNLKKTLLSAPMAIRTQTRHLAKAQGKNIRASALLCAACTNNIDKNSNAEYVKPEAVDAAVAIELLHLATLVHDDIIDKAPKRRGIATLNSLFGERVAVLCGDYLLSVALQLAFDISPQRFGRSKELGKVLAQALSDICIGELAQSENQHNFDLSEQKYMKIISGKTAALFKVSFLMGFIFSDEDEQNWADYAELGNNIGLIFQLADDLLDYTSDETKTKKPVMNDYAQGVVTLPLIYAMRQSSELKAAVKQGIDTTELKQKVAALGGIDYTRKKIETLSKKSKAQIELLASEPKKQKLLALTNFAAGK